MSSDQTSNNSTDTQRIERGIERINDKVDLVWTGVSELKANFARLETESITIAKDTERNRIDIENYREENSKKFGVLTDKLSQLEKDQSDLKIRLAPIFLVITLIITVVVNKVTVSYIGNPTPVVAVK